MKVLIVDDDSVSRLVLARGVALAGHEAVEATHVDQALALFRTGEFQVVLTDWQMPGRSGPELCAEIRRQRRPRYTYLVLVTTRGGTTRFVEGLDAGADDFVTKPVDPTELAARLRVAERILSMQKEMEQLRGLLSICTYCKKIREGEAWVQVEQYVARRTDASFSHGICQGCYARHFPEESA